MLIVGDSAYLMLDVWESGMTTQTGTGNCGAGKLRPTLS
jgi:hypothetical protein